MFAGRSQSVGVNKQGKSAMYGSGMDPVGVNSISSDSNWNTYGMNSASTKTGMSLFCTVCRETLPCMSCWRIPWKIGNKISSKEEVAPELLVQTILKYIFLSIPTRVDCTV